MSAADIVASAREFADGLDVSLTEAGNARIHIARLADTIEQLITDLDARFEHSDHQSAKYYQRMRAAEREMHARELHHFEEEQKSAGLAAVIERLRLVHAGQSRLALSAVFMADVDDDEGVQAFYREWVRNHDAALIESLADHLDRNFQDIPAWTEAYREGVRTDEWMRGAVRMTTGAVRWLHERARQVREGEA